MYTVGQVHGPISKLLYQNKCPPSGNAKIGAVFIGIKHKKQQ